MSLASLSYRLFKNFSKKYSTIFSDLNQNLKISGLGYSIDEYFSMFLFIAIFGTVASFAMSFILLSVFFNSFLIGIFGAAIISVPIFGAIMLIFRIYPTQLIQSKRKKIENMLFFSTVYMSTVAGTGAPPQSIFKILAEFGEFGEVSKTANDIMQDIEIFGLDIIDALEHTAEKTPSENLKELLWGMRSTITSGGNLKGFLDEKAKGFSQIYKRKLEEFTRTLSIFLEVYITIVIVGSVFILVLTTIMSLVGGFTEQLQMIQMMLIVIGLPMITAVYIVILKSVSPTEV
jgi:flagellar protein FlaJ